jgi:hypothetical protein
MYGETFVSTTHLTQMKHDLQHIILWLAKLLASQMEREYLQHVMSPNYLTEMTGQENGLTS